MVDRDRTHMLARLSRAIDRFIDLLKWPVALLAVVALPRAAIALLAVVRRIPDSPGDVLPLVVGFAGYLALWWLFLRRRPFGSFFSTLEHELTHALFALLTFHPVTGLSATFRRGGRMSFRGDGNWLITIAPYFFPTAALAVLAASAFLEDDRRRIATGLLGAALGYHITSTLEETHVGQSDLKLVGWPFALAFLPAANLLAFGTILSFAAAGTEGLMAFLRDIVSGAGP